MFPHSTKQRSMGVKTEDRTTRTESRSVLLRSCGWRSGLASFVLHLIELGLGVPECLLLVGNLLLKVGVVFTKALGMLRHVGGIGIEFRRLHGVLTLQEVHFMGQS